MPVGDLINLGAYVSDYENEENRASDEWMNHISLNSQYPSEVNYLYGSFFTILEHCFPASSSENQETGSKVIKMTELSEKRKRMIFAGGLVLLVALSMDFWNWTSAVPLVLGMPFWVIWNILIVLATGFYFLMFSLYLWRN